MAKGNLGLLVIEDWAEGNVLVGLKMADTKRRMIQGIHMVMVKFGGWECKDGVEIMNISCFGPRDVWRIFGWSGVFLLSFPILSRKNSNIKHASLSTRVKKTNGCDRFVIFGRDYLDFDRRYGYGMVMNENGGREQVFNLVCGWENFCSGFQVFNIRKMTFLFANETSAFLSVRKPFAVGFLFSEKVKLFRTSFPGGKWEFGFPKM
ncbi:hypothetical protein WN943_026997 [Citrus x changshan-huyou]